MVFGKDRTSKNLLLFYTSLLKGKQREREDTMREISLTYTTNYYLEISKHGNLGGPHHKHITLTELEMGYKISNPTLKYVYIFIHTKKGLKKNNCYELTLMI